jgi:hypothetical protein
VTSTRWTAHSLLEVSLRAKYITKMNYPRNRGYWVRFYKNKELIVQRSFPLSTYGGDWESNLRAAISWRDQQLGSNPLLKDFSVDVHQGVAYRKEPPKNNTSGRVGVHQSTDTWHGKKIPCWVATFNLNKRPRTVKFAIHTHGEERAHRLAMRARELGEKLLDQMELI